MPKKEKTQEPVQGGIPFTKEELKSKTSDILSKNDIIEINEVFIESAKEKAKFELRGKKKDRLISFLRRFERLNDALKRKL
jgi:hypothetical protein